MIISGAGFTKLIKLSAQMLKIKNYTNNTEFSYAKKYFQGTFGQNN